VDGEGPDGAGELLDGLGQPGGSRLLGAGGAGGVAGQHAGVVDGEVDLGEGAFAAAQVVEVGPAGDGQAGVLGAHGEDVLECLHLVVDRAGGPQRGVRAGGVPVGERDGDLVQGGAEAVEDAVGGLAGDLDVVAREHEGGDEQRHAAADQALEDPVGGEGGHGGGEGGEQDGARGGLADDEVTAAQQDGGGHGEHDEQAELQRAGAEQRQHGAGDRQPDEHAGDQLERLAAAAAVGGAEADDGGDAGERGVLGGQQRDGDAPGAGGGDGGLQDRAEVGTEAVDRHAPIPSASHRNA